MKTIVNFLRKPTADQQVALDLAEARLALLATSKLREYYAAVEVMLKARITRLEREINNDRT